MYELARLWAGQANVILQTLPHFLRDSFTICASIFPARPSAFCIDASNSTIRA
jgi:hypothetical protein